MDNAAGDDLSWFWRGWILNSWKPDQSVVLVKYVDSNDIKKGVKITIANKEKMVMPASVKITEESGNTTTVRLPAEVWQKGGLGTFWYPSPTAIKEVLMDPDKQLPDIDRTRRIEK